jgi:hypothetical protein
VRRWFGAQSALVPRNAHTENPALHRDRPHAPVVLDKGVLLVSVTVDLRARGQRRQAAAVLARVRQGSVVEQCGATKQTQVSVHI